MNKQQRIQRLEKEINELKKEIENEEFEVGKWVWCNGDTRKYLIKITKFSELNVHGFGFDYVDGEIDEWFSEQAVVFKEKIVREATEDEIKQALDKERKRRGLVEGTKVVDIAGIEETIGRQSKLLTEDGYDKEEDSYYIKGVGVYENGNWAEPIQQNKIYDYTVEHKGGKFYKIGCEESLERSFLEQLAALTKKHEIKIELEGHDVTEDIKTLKL